MTARFTGSPRFLNYGKFSTASRRFAGSPRFIAPANSAIRAIAPGIFPIAWFDAAKSTFQDSAGTTPAVADADPVGLWRDLSGYGHHLSQVDALNRRPTLRLNKVNGKPAIFGPGYGGGSGLIYLYNGTFSIAPQVTVFCVEYLPTDLSALVGTSLYVWLTLNGTLAGFTDDMSHEQIGGATFKTNVLDNAGEIQNTQGGINQWMLTTCVSNNASSSIQINNGAPVTGNLTDAVMTAIKGILLFGVPFPNGGPASGTDAYIAEFIICPVLTPNQITTVKNYLNAKYAIY